MSDQPQNERQEMDEMLSALVDSELSETDIERVLANSDKADLQRWGRYHLVRDALHNEMGALPEVDLSQLSTSISSAIADEPALQVDLDSNDDINSPLLESVSAFVDGEATELEMRRICKTTDTAVTQKWERYNVIGDVIRKDLSLAQSINVSPQVSAAIADSSVSETPEIDTAKTAPNRLWATIGRFGVAASFAGAVVFGVQFLSTSNSVNIVDNGAAPASTNPQFGSETSVRVVGGQQTNTAEIIEEQQVLDEESKSSEQVLEK